MYSFSQLYWYYLRLALPIFILHQYRYVSTYIQFKFVYRRDIPECVQPFLGRGEVKLEQMGVLTHILPVVVLARGYAIVRATFLINITSRRNSRNSLVSQRLYVQYVCLHCKGLPGAFMTSFDSSETVWIYFL